MAPRFLARLGVGRKRRDSRVHPVRGACCEDPKDRPLSLLTSTPILVSSGEYENKIEERPSDITSVYSNQGQSGFTLTLQEPPQQGRKRKFMDSLNHAVKRVMTGISRKFTSTSLTESGSRSRSELPVLHSPILDEHTKCREEEGEEEEDETEAGTTKSHTLPSANLLDEVEWREIRVVERFTEEVRAQQGQAMGIDIEDLELPEELILETAALIALYRERAIAHDVTGEAVKESITRDSPEPSWEGFINQSTKDDPDHFLISDDENIDLEGAEAKVEETAPQPESTLKDTQGGTEELFMMTQSLTGEAPSLIPIKDGACHEIVSEDDILGDVSSPDESASEGRVQSQELFTMRGGLIVDEEAPPAEHSILSDSFVSCISHHSSFPSLAPLFGWPDEPSEREPSLEYLELLADLFREEDEEKPKREAEEGYGVANATGSPTITQPVQRAFSASPMTANDVPRWSSSCSLTDSHSGSRSDGSRGPRRRSSRISHLIALFEGSIMDLASEERDHREE